MGVTIPINEHDIQVPWGHISVKAWGNPSDIPVLVIHGIQDNSGSWDHLIPLLPRGHYYHCIDLPGHGKSSHLPPGLPLHFYQYVYAVKVVIEHLQWSQFTLMGHSLGAQISVFFSSLYPEKVLRAILIDGLTPLVTPENRIVPSLRKYFDNLYKIHKTVTTKKPPSYSHEEALKRLMDNRDTVLTRSSAEGLIARALIPSGEGFMYSTDQRLKLRLRPMLTMEQMRHIVKNMKCPALMIIAKDTYDLIDAVSEELYHERLNKLFVVMPNFKFAVVEGNHDVHMNYPERVAPLVCNFLIKSMNSHL